VGGKWVPGRHFHGIVPRKLGLKGVVLRLFLQSKGVVFTIGRRKEFHDILSSSPLS
jgi:hypothetical protein